MKEVSSCIKRTMPSSCAISSRICRIELTEEEASFSKSKTAGRRARRRHNWVGQTPPGVIALRRSIQYFAHPSPPATVQCGQHPVLAEQPLYDATRLQPWAHERPTVEQSARAEDACLNMCLLAYGLPRDYRDERSRVPMFEASTS